MSAPEHLRRDGQPQQADEKKTQVKDGLASWREAANRRVRVEIAEKKCGLKKDQARGPDGRRTSEPRENQFGDEWFDQEKKKRSEKNRRGKEQPMRNGE